MNRILEKLLPKLKTREAEVKYIDKVAEGVWTTHQKSFVGRLPGDIPKWQELTDIQKRPARALVQRVLIQLQKMRVKFK